MLQVDCLDLNLVAYLSQLMYTTRIITVICKYIFRVMRAFLLILSMIALGCPEQETKKPNFLIISADDMWFSNAGCYGREISNPCLNILITNGLRYSQFYSSSRCWASRAAGFAEYLVANNQENCSFIVTDS